MAKQSFTDIAKVGEVWQTTGSLVWLSCQHSPDHRTKYLPARTKVKVLYVEKHLGKIPDRLVLQIYQPGLAEELHLPEVSIWHWPAEVFYL